MLKCVHSEPTVRAELMEQVPNIAMFLHESRPNFPAAFSRYLVPIVVRYLTDPNNQVGYRFLVFLDDITNILKPQSGLYLGANEFLFPPDKIFIRFSYFILFLLSPSRFTGSENESGSAACSVGAGPYL